MSLSRSRRLDHGPKVEINVVPLVDVSLVLLIIFMVTATFIKATGMNIRLPGSSAARSSAQLPRTLIIGVRSDGVFVWKSAPISDDALLAGLKGEAAESGTGRDVTIQGDERAEHGRIVRAMTLAQKAGFSHLTIAVRKDSGTNG